jgi:amino acid adenylation domain-containing protein/FkbM family methyltransferase
MSSVMGEHPPVHLLIERQASITPDRPAVVFRGLSLSYAELDRRANRLAWRLREAGVKTDAIVGVCEERGPDLVVALLAVLKAGGAYLPLEPDLPAERLAFLLEDAAPTVVLARSGSAARLGAVPLIALDGPEPADVPDTAAHGGVAGTDLAYVIYTSGSTGRPKGAMNTHAALANRLAWMQRRYQLGPDDAVLHKTPIGFDVSVWELLWPLLAGARLVPAEPGGHKDPDYLADLVAAERITTMHFVPSMLAAFLETADLPRRCASLRRVVCSGEALTVELQNRFGRMLGAELHNLYGPTEAAIDVTAWACVPGDGRARVPIGRPIDNCRVYVLDETGAPAAPGEPGELWLGGVCVGRGYLNRPELTAQCFREDPFAAEPGARMYRTGDRGRIGPDGVIDYLGRLDDQVKIRGQRVEPGEIEAVLAAHPAVRAAAVVATEAPAPAGGGPGEIRLCAFVVPGGERTHELRRLLDLERAGEAGDRSRHRLADGTVVFGLNPGETAFLDEEIFGRREYLRHGIGLPEHAVVFDVGANIGVFALYIGRVCPSATVYSFEPMPAVHALLRLNARLGRAAVHALGYGLSDVPGEAEFTYFPHVSIISGQYADQAEDRRALTAHARSRWREEAGAGEVAELVDAALHGEPVRARLRTVSEVLREYGLERVDLLKVDVERAELAVLRGVEAADWPRVAQVVVEVQDTGGRLAEVAKLLREAGFRVTAEEQGELAGSGLYYVYGSRGPGFPPPPLPAPVLADPADLVADLRAYAAARLTDAMLPSAVTVLPELPELSNGKVDRRALATLAAEAAAEAAAAPGTGCSPAAPRTDLEHTLLRLWERLLRRDGVGVTDDLFALGGTSLTAARIAAGLRAEAGLRVPVTTVLAHPTVAALAAVLSAAEV